MEMLGFVPGIFFMVNSGEFLVKVVEGDVSVGLGCRRSVPADASAACHGDLFGLVSSNSAP